MAVINITEDSFQKEVMESEKTVLLDFWAGWCNPCKMLAPLIDEIAEENPDIKVVKVNVDEERVLAERFKIMSIPALMVIKNGNVAEKMTGAGTKQQILSMIK